MRRQRRVRDPVAEFERICPPHINARVADYYKSGGRVLYEGRLLSPNEAHDWARDLMCDDKIHGGAG